MRKLIQLLMAGCFGLLLLGNGTALGQIIIAQDDASNYGGNWGTGTNGGFGFGEWTITTGTNDGYAGAFIGNPSYGGIEGMSSTSFGLYAHPANPDGPDSGNFVNADRTFQPLEVGATLSVQWGVYWDGGGFARDKGIKLYASGADGTELVHILMGGNQNIYINGEEMFNEFGAQAMTINFEYQEDTKIRVYATGRDGTEAFDQTLTVAAGTPNAIRFYASNLAKNDGDGDLRQPYFNNFKITSPVVSTMILTNPGYRFLSSPVADATLNTLLGENNIFTQCFDGATYTGEVCVPYAEAEGNGEVTENVFFYENDDWVAADNITNAVEPGTGVIAYIYGDDMGKSISVTGTENATDVSVNLNSNAGGFTLLGNPFASSIDYDAIDNVDLTGAVYIWDPNDESGDGGTDDNNPGGRWKSYSDGAGDITGGFIAPFQGFFVETVKEPSENPTVTFGANAKTSGAVFHGKQIAEDPVFVRFQVQGNGLSTSAWLQFSETGSEIERVRGDALKLESLSGQFAQLAFSKQISPLLDIAHMPIQDGNYELPVHFTATASGSYSISASQFQIPAGLKLTFHDFEKDVAIPVDEHFTYSFNFELPQATKVADVPPLKRLLQAPMVAKSDEDAPRFAISISAGLGVSNEAPHGRPSGFALAQNYPNPFNPSTVIGYQLPQNGHVRLEVFDMLGQKVATLVDGVVAAGAHQVTFDGNGLSSGVYIYRLSAGNQVFTKKLTLIK